MEAGAKEALSLYLVFDRRIGNGFIKREGKRATQVRKPFFQKAVGHWKASHIPEGNRIAAKLHKILTESWREGPWGTNRSINCALTSH